AAAAKLAFRETMLHDAQMIIDHYKDVDKLVFSTEKQDSDLKRFLTNLRRSNSNHWAEWCENAFENNLIFSRPQFKAVPSIFEAVRKLRKYGNEARY
ncbi:MAG: hypothetical protein FWG42_10945, partial [Clostridiales bacterium]|nr:hypothetical protein [Clostridiales bacterium]